MQEQIAQSCKKWAREGKNSSISYVLVLETFVSTRFWNVDKFFLAARQQSSQIVVFRRREFDTKVLIYFHLDSDCSKSGTILYGMCRTDYFH